jgi:hypothetical protein
VNTLTRVLLLPITALPILFLMCIGLIQAQPYDDHHLQALLTPPDGCMMPCFIGIRPGVTRLDDAVTILRTHEWVENYAVHITTIGGVLITWSWSGQQPDYIDSRIPGGLSTGDTNFVDRIDFATHLSLGSFVLWKRPPSGGLRCTSVPRVIGLFVHYSEGLVAEVPMPPMRCPGRCPIRMQDLWVSRTLVTIGNNYLPDRDYATLIGNPTCDG